MEQFITWFILVNILLTIISLIHPVKYKTDCLFLAPMFAVGGAMSLASMVMQGIQAAKQNKLANGINPVDPEYQISPYAKANLGLAQSLYNGRMAGAPELERNIQANQATTLGSINRNATSSSQALALAGAVQGQTNNSLQGLQAAEAQNKMNTAGMVMDANRGLVNEGDKVFQDELRRYQNDVQAKLQLKQAAANNFEGLFSSLSSAAMMAGMADFGDRPGKGFGNFKPANVGGAGIMSGLMPMNTSSALQTYNQPGVTLGSQPSGGTGSMSPGHMWFNPFNYRR